MAFGAFGTNGAIRTEIGREDKESVLDALVKKRKELEDLSSETLSLVIDQITINNDVNDSLQMKSVQDVDSPHYRLGNSVQVRPPHIVCPHNTIPVPNPR